MIVIETQVKADLCRVVLTTHSNGDPATCIDPIVLDNGTSYMISEDHEDDILAIDGITESDYVIREVLPNELKPAETP